MSADGEYHFYIFPYEENPVNENTYSFNAIFSFYLLLNGFIPLDLAVTISLSKIFYVFYINLDAQMINEEASLRKGEV